MTKDKLLKFISPLVLTLLYLGLIVGNNNQVAGACASQANSSLMTSVTLESFHIFSKIRYRFGQTKIFCVMHNNASLAQEATFEMDLPDGAFVSNFTMQVNDQRYNSFIEEKLNANEKYNKFKKLGQTAGIINEENNVFRISISLEANASVLFHLEYEEEIIKVSNGEGHYEYSVSVIPQLRDVKHFCVDVDILEFKEFTISYLNLCSQNSTCIEMDMQKESMMLRQEPKSKKIIWEPTSVPGKKDELLKYGVLGKFKINYEFPKNDSINEVLIRNGYFVHRFGPRNLPTIPIHVIFVLDISASMEGARMKQMTSAMWKILNDLKSHDYFNIVTFSSSAKVWWPYPNETLEETKQFPALRADYYFKEMAKKYILDLEFEGSTNIYAAIMTALEIAKYTIQVAKDHKLKNKTMIHDFESLYDVNPTPMIFFLTDGSPTCGIINSTIILEKVVEGNADLSVPIFSLAFGSSADFILLQALSTQNRGIARRLYDNVVADLQLKHFYDFVASPVLTNLIFKYTSSLGTISNVTTSNEPWLLKNTEIAVAGKIEHLEKDHGLQMAYQFQVFAEGFSETQYQFRAKICPCGLCSNPLESSENYTKSHFKSGNLCTGKYSDKDLFLEKFWVHKMIRKMIREVIKGNDSLVKDITELALKYNLVTPYTSLLIITPLDKSTDENRVTFDDPSSLANSVYRDRNRNDKSLINLTKPKFTNKLKNYSINWTSETSSDRDTIEPQSLEKYLQSLISEQETRIYDFLINRTISTDMDKKITLADLKWLDKVGNNITLLAVVDGKIGWHNFKIKKSLEQSQKTFPRCRIRKGRNISGEGQCTHLVNCIQEEFLADLKKLVNSFFCPLREGLENFVGVCCPSSKNESLKN